ncbi:MAG: PcfJ domain-containing protein [Hyphomicrobiales bacterium]|nr:PcfJ domain-containing protein [Hyphomicrobiales bacterium]
MSSPACVLSGARGRSEARSIERRIARFAAPHRAACAKLAARHPWLADLAFSFPALFFALAAPPRGWDREPAVALACAGARLRIVAASAGVPLWLRRLPPEAFTAPLDALPDGAVFRRQIANHLPPRPREAAQWLNVVTRAATYGDPLFAVWIAREYGRNKWIAHMPRSLRLMALWAWFSARPHTWGAKVWPHRFSTDMCWAAARAEMVQWARIISSEIYLGFAQRRAWLEGGVLGEYELTPLTSATDVRDEAAAMQHCIASYADAIAENSVCIFSLRRNGARVATLELSRVPGSALLQIAQIRGPKNEPPPEEAVVAAHRWVCGARLQTIPEIVAIEPQADVWRAVWRPYWLERRHIPEWLPLTPDMSLLNPYDGSVRMRGRRI